MKKLYFIAAALVSRLNFNQVYFERNKKFLSFRALRFRLRSALNSEINIVTALAT